MVPAESTEWTSAPQLPAARWTTDDPYAVRPLSVVDLTRPWRLDFHQPRGVVPLGIGFAEAIASGSRWAASELGVDGGLICRLVGVHVYLGPAGSTSLSGTEDADAMDRLVPGGDYTAYARGFARQWQETADRLREDLESLDNVSLEELPAPELATVWDRAVRVHQESWRVHFAVMYPVFAIHERFVGVCAKHGFSALQATAMLGMPDHSIARADRALAELAALAREAGIEAIFVHTPASQVLRRLRGEARAAGWLSALDRFLAEHGRRSAAVSDLDSPAWTERPQVVVGLVRAALVGGLDAQRGSGSVPATLDQLTAAGRDEVEAARALAVSVHAPWWNEEHNALIDLRAHLPARGIALAAGRLLRLPRARDALYLLEPELSAVLRGNASVGELLPVLRERRHYVEAWRARRSELPGHLGAEDSGSDLVMRQILGMADARVAAPATPMSELDGLGVSPGVARGRARVLSTADDIVTFRSGEVLVCQATSPSWTPAFSRAAAAVCDAGGLLTHAATVSREYGLPCVCAVLVGTTVIRTGDLVEVDGDAGTVRILERGGQR